MPLFYWTLIEYGEFYISGKSTNTKTMGVINELVEQAMQTGYLTLEAEDQLRKLVQTTKYDAQDFHAFVNLQLAAQEGRVRQESRDKLNLD